MQVLSPKGIPILVLNLLTGLAQPLLRTEEGFLLPTRDTVCLLVVFAEIDYSACGEDPHEKQFGPIWPRDASGRSQIPADADMLVGLPHTGETAFRGKITQVYAEASFGQFVVVGDYLPEVVRVPCEELPPQGTWSLVEEVGLIARHWPQHILATAHRVPWAAFDRWQLLPQRAGLPKLRAPADTGKGYIPRLDVLFIIWRNLAYRLGVKPPFPCNYGFGLWTCDFRQPFGPFQGGVEAASSYTSCQTAQGAAVGFLVEFFHGLYGGNHWHTAGGAGLHTFPFLPACRGLSTQGGRPIYAIGYDRWVMGWKAPDKLHLISALDEEGREVPTDLKQPTQPETLRVWLRDFLTTGDAVRIRLPYTEKGGPSVKNQYLWLENRRFLSSTEVWRPPEWADCPPWPYPAYPQGLPGLYAYIQVGKDRKEGPDIYSSHPAHPNGLGSWIFPLSAEGHYDFVFRSKEGKWAIDWTQTLPNPFMGMHDLYLAYDTDRDGKVHPSQEPGEIGKWEWAGDSLRKRCGAFGDERDGFGFHTQVRLNLETNPAPVPVYTLCSAEHYRSATLARPSPYDNRIIWLNGLHIEILRERADGALLIEIIWDNLTIRKFLRWCGHIRLSPHPFYASAPALTIWGTLLLDRSLSPTYGSMVEYDSLMRRPWFSDTSLLVVEQGAVLQIAKRGRLILRRGSRLVLQPGAQVTGKGWIIVEPGGRIEVGPEATLEIPISYRKRPLPMGRSTDSHFLSE